MRTKQVEFDGQKFTIAALNLEQVEEIFPTKEDGTVTTHRGWDGAVQIIVCGLNNARPDIVSASAPSNPPWDARRVRQELDFPTMRWLKDEIVDFSELSEPKKKSPEGPAPAASAIQ